MTEYCKRFDKCYFPKDVAKNCSGVDKEQLEKYLNSCNYKGMDCDLEKMDDISFKIFERFKKVDKVRENLERNWEDK